MSNLIHDTQSKAFIEQDCTFDFGGGKTYTSGGAYLARRIKDNKLEGILYAYPNENKIGTWDGSTKWPAYFGNEWRGNMGDKRQSVYATIDGVKVYGVYYKSAGDIVRVKQIGKDN